MVEYNKEQIETIKKILEIAPQIDYNFERGDFEKWKHLTSIFIRKGKLFLLEITMNELAEQISDGQWEEEVVKKSIVDQEKEEMKKAYRLQMKEVAKNIKITDIATSYGLRLKGNKSVCPFHGDTDPSLTFSNSKGVFNCFGCGEKGNIITFIKKMEDLKNGNYNGTS